MGQSDVLDNGGDHPAAAPSSQRGAEVVRLDVRASRGSRGAPQRSDEQLVVAILAGEARAQRELITRYGRLVAQILLNVLGPRSDLDDLLQETYLIAFRDLGRLRRPEALRSWLVSVAVSRAKNQLRSDRRRWWLTFRQPHELPELHSAEGDQEAVRAVYEALQRMKPDARTLFALRYIQGFSTQEVAQATATSETTTRRRLAAARDRFDRLVADDARLKAWLGGTP